MKSILARSVFAPVAIVAVTSLAPVTVLAADLTMNLGFDAPADSTYGFAAEAFKTHLEELSGGSIEVKIRCCGQISSEDNAFKAMQLGTVDGYYVSNNNIAPHWPLMDVTVLPYIFQSTEHMLKVANGPVGERISQQMQADTGVHLMAFNAPQPRDFYNSVRPIESLADMSGLKVRVPQNKVMLETFAAFGAQPVPLPWSETPTALQTGTVEGGDNGTSFIMDMKFYEFEEHLVILDHFIAISPLLVSDAFMRRLDDEQRAAVREAARLAGIEHTEFQTVETEKVREWLSTEGGMTLSRPDTAEFISAARPVQEAVAAERGEAFAEMLAAINAAAE
ncbi:MAG: TRAP transporter substrate-binding protein [Limimaricola soesokkakensis]|uniref:TRAP transporter substrate-binding protein n=1 Tax=Limimaricola soesokkakensis TaxID=1343159 RepID=UPI00405A2333